MAKVYRVKFNFIFDEENPVPCEFSVEAENFGEAHFNAASEIADFFELCSVSEEEE